MFMHFCWMEHVRSRHINRLTISYYWSLTNSHLDNCSLQSFHANKTRRMLIECCESSSTHGQEHHSDPHTHQAKSRRLQAATSTSATNLNRVVEHPSTSSPASISASFEDPIGLAVFLSIHGRRGVPSGSMDRRTRIRRRRAPWSQRRASSPPLTRE